MKFCVHCGSGMGEGRFCANCGKPIYRPVDSFTMAAAPAPAMDSSIQAERTTSGEEARVSSLEYWVRASLLLVILAECGWWTCGIAGVSYIFGNERASRQLDQLGLRPYLQCVLIGFFCLSLVLLHLLRFYRADPHLRTKKAVRCFVAVLAIAFFLVFLPAILTYQGSKSVGTLNGMMDPQMWGMNFFPVLRFTDSAPIIAALNFVLLIPLNVASRRA